MSLTHEEFLCLVNLDDENIDWEPPSDAEMKVFQARRERQDKISKLMGDYMLKGYKMLAECCDLCGVRGKHVLHSFICDFIKRVCS